MKNIVIMSFLSPWSMGEGKGAPSFQKTISGYSNDWNVCLITPLTPGCHDSAHTGVKHQLFKPASTIWIAVPKLRFIGRIVQSIIGAYRLYSLGDEYIKHSGKNTVIYAYEVHAVWAGKRLSKKYNLPFVTRFQGTVLYPVKTSFKNRIKHYPHFGALKTAADITIMTDDGTFGMDTLKRLGNASTNVFFWRNGVDIGHQYTRNPEAYIDFKEKLGIGPDDKVLLTVSRLVAWKRVDRAITALKNLVDDGHVDIKLLIAGDGDAQQMLMGLVSQYNLNDKVIFAGALSQEQIAICFDIADVFLSLYDLSNVGNPLLEAMSMGKPIITLNTGATSQLITNNINGVLLDLEQIPDIPKYIVKILKNAQYAHSLAREARTYAEKYNWTWEDRIETETKIVSELLEKNGEHLE